jgi:transcriptional regulator with XRE-family HTH domain
MKGKMLDTYERWEASGNLDIKLKAISEMISKRATQKQIAQYLGISEKTLIKLRKTHSKLDRAFQYGDEELKQKLLDAMYQRAIGFDYEETQTVIEETKTGTKKRITKYKKKSLPEIAAIKYLLIIKFGLEYNDKKEEIELMNKRLEKGEEVWKNEFSHEESNPINRIRKQSEK